ncbi:MAG: DMT family transporter [Anaerolineales bacterium]
MTQKSAPLILILGVFAVSTAAIFIRFAQGEVPSLTVAAYRLTLASLLIAPFVLRQSTRRAELRALTRRDLLLALLAGTFLALHFAAWITSLEKTSVASSVVLVTTTPLWVALISPLALRESVGRGAALGLLLALGGGIIVGLSEACQWDAAGLQCSGLSALWGGETFAGNFLALFGAWMAAAYLTIGRSVRVRLSLWSYALLVYGMAAVVLLLLALVTGAPLSGFSPNIWLWLFLLALVPQVIGHSAFNWALAYLPASFVAVTLLGEPIGSSILAYFLLRETPSGLELLGAILILAGIYIVSTQPTPRNTPA